MPYPMKRVAVADSLFFGVIVRCSANYICYYFNMNRIALTLALCLGLFSCGCNNTGNGSQNKGTGGQHEVVEAADGVEVLFFYGRQRCLTCKAIERATEELLNVEFADELGNGRLVFRKLSIDDNEALAEKYRVTWTSLVVVGHCRGDEKVENLTEFAFAKARKSPDAFKKGLYDKIIELQD